MLSPQAGRGEDRDRCAIIELPNQPQPAFDAWKLLKVFSIAIEFQPQPINV
jgi:hypothetical protein